jgi:hypothetical protein
VIHFDPSASACAADAAQPIRHHANYELGEAKGLVDENPESALRDLHDLDIALGHGGQ